MLVGYFASRIALFTLFNTILGYYGLLGCSGFWYIKCSSKDERLLITTFTCF